MPKQIYKITLTVQGETHQFKSLYAASRFMGLSQQWLSNYMKRNRIGGFPVEIKVKDQYQLLIELLPKNKKLYGFGAAIAEAWQDNSKVKTLSRRIEATAHQVGYSPYAVALFVDNNIRPLKRKTIEQYVNYQW